MRVLSVSIVLLLCCHPKETAETAARKRAERQQIIAVVEPATAGLDAPLMGADGTDADGYPRRYVNQPRLRRLLSEDKFAELNRTFEELQRAFEANPRNEYWPTAAADAFDLAYPAMGAALDAWVAATPASFAPWVARGAYWVATASARRGYAYADRTHPSNFSKMEEALRHATADLDHALSINPKLIGALRLRISVERMRSGDIDKPLIQSIRVCSECFRVRVQYLVTLEPRWGGSYRQMEDFARSAPVQKNRRLRFLPGYIDSDKADLLLESGDLDGAIQAVNHALAIGEYPGFLRQRADLYNRKEQYAAALRDIERADELQPGEAAIHFLRAYARAGLGNWLDSGRDLLAGLQLDPVSSMGKMEYADTVAKLDDEGWRLYRASKPDEALLRYDVVVGLDPADDQLKERRSAVLAAATAHADGGAPNR